MWRALLVAVTLMVSGCGGQKLIVKGYQGADLPKEQVGWIKPVAGLHVYSIDGDKALRVLTTHAIGYYDAEIALPAGRHQVEIALANGVVSARQSRVIDIYVEPQRKYLFKYSVTFPEPRKYYMEPGIWQVQVLDMTNEPEKWCGSSHAETC